LVYHQDIASFKVTQSLLDAQSEVVWPGLMVFWPGKDHLARYSTRTEMKRQTGEDWEDIVREWTGLEFSDSQRVAKDREM